MSTPTFLIAAIGMLLLASVPMASEDVRHGAYNEAPEGTSTLLDEFPEIRVGHARLEGPLDPRQSIAIVGPVVAFNDAETTALRDFVEAGGRLLIADDQGSGVGLASRLDLGIELAGVPVYSPIFETDPRSPIVSTTGRIPGLPERFSLPLATAVTGIGEPIIAAHDLAWLDLDADGRPGLDEPQGRYAFGMVRHFGQGDLMVIGSAAILDNTGHPMRNAVIDWLIEGDRVVVLDEGHRPAVDPVGMAGVLAGHAAWVPWLIPVALVVVATRTLQVRITRVQPRRQRPVAGDHPALQELDP